MPIKSKKLKLLYIADLLRRRSDEEHTLTIQEISDYLAEMGIKAERKSLYDDLNLLRDFGYDIISVKAKHYGYYLAGREFEDVELKLLVDAVQSSRFITRKKSTELIKKLESLSSEYAASRLDRQVYVANRIKNSNESIYYNVDKIHRAIHSDRNITFKYFDWTSKKEKQFRHDGKTYNVSPWALSWSDENYYLIGYEDGAIKHYRVDRMMYIAQTGEKREGEEKFGEFDLSLYSQKFFKMFDGKSETVTLKCASSLSGVIIDRFGKDVKIYDDDGDSFKVDINIALSDMFFGWAMSFGEKLTVEKPAHVRASLRDYAKKILEQYQ